MQEQDTSGGFSQEQSAPSESQTPPSGGNVNEETQSQQAPVEDEQPEQTTEAEQTSQTDEGGSDSGKRSAEARIQQLNAEKKELEKQLRQHRQGSGDDNKVPMPPTSQRKQLTPEEQRAREVIRNMGFVSEDEVEERVRSIQERIFLETEHSKLSNTYDGSDGRPQYDPDEIEDYMKEKSIPHPEMAYKLKYEDELTEWNVKKAASEKKERPYTAPPSAPSSSQGDSNAITRDKISEMMSKGAEGRAWWEKNRDKVFSLMAEGKLR